MRQQEICLRHYNFKAPELTFYLMFNLTRGRFSLLLKLLILQSDCLYCLYTLLRLYKGILSSYPEPYITLFRDISLSMDRLLGLLCVPVLSTVGWDNVK